MTAPLGQWRATYTPGEWFALAGPTSLVLLEPPRADVATIVDSLWDEVVASSSMADLAARLATHRIDTMPSFAAFFWTSTGMRSLVRGAVTIVDLETGAMVASGAGIQTWSEVGLAGVERIQVAAAQPSPADGPALPLVVGAVRASSLILDASEHARVSSPQGLVETTLGDEESWGTDDALADSNLGTPSEAVRGGIWAETGEMSVLDGLATQLTPPPWADEEPSGAATQPDAAPEPDVEAPPDAQQQEMENGETQLMSPALMFADPAVAGAAAPAADAQGSDDALVLAIVCPYGHASPPNATICRVCGSPIAPQNPQRLMRPALAVLRSSDGTAVALDRVVLVGRAPSGERPGALSPRLLTVLSPSQDISRTHLEVSPDGWQVAVTDLHSTNGTVLIPPGGGVRHQLTAGETITVPLGSVMELGDGVSVLIDFPQ
jgi:hypothetical protein